MVRNSRRNLTRGKRTRGKRTRGKRSSRRVKSRGKNKRGGSPFGTAFSSIGHNLKLSTYHLNGLDTTRLKILDPLPYKGQMMWGKALRFN